MGLVFELGVPDAMREQSSAEADKQLCAVIGIPLLQRQFEYSGRRAPDAISSVAEVRTN